MRDFDYVLMADYQHDMREMSDTAAAMVSHLRRETRELHALIWRLVTAAGGRIEIPLGTMIADPGELLRAENAEHWSMIFVARRAKEKPNASMFGS